MKKDKVKSNLLIWSLIIIFISLFLYPIVKMNLKTEELIVEGIKTEALIQNMEKLRVRRLNYYSITLKYKDFDGNEYNETIPVSGVDFYKNSKGQKVEILYMPDNPKEVDLVNYKKLYKTEERDLKPQDLRRFNVNKDVDFIYNELNKISFGWLLDEKDSTLFLN